MRLVENNTCYDNGLGGGSGINATAFELRHPNNLIYNTHAGHLAYRIDAAPSTGNLVVNNTVLVAANGRWAMNVHNASIGNTIRDNIFYSAVGNYGAMHFTADSIAGTVSDYNMVEDRFTPDDDASWISLSQWRTLTGLDAHSIITSNPSTLFVNAAGGDYHLVAGSAAIDVGTTASAPPTDFEGTPRPSGNGVDIGYDEFAASAPATTHFQVSAPATTTAGTSFSITVSALTSSNAVDSTYRGTVHFTSSDGQAVLPANYTFTAADVGQHTFQVTFKTTGAHSVSVTDTANSALQGTANVTITTTSQILVLAGLGQTVIAGPSQTITVTLMDNFGNVATGYLGTVHFASSDGQSVLPADYSFTASDKGKHTFQATFKTVGAQFLSATDTTSGALTATANFSVNVVIQTLSLSGLGQSATAGAAMHRDSHFAR